MSLLHVLLVLIGNIVADRAELIAESLAFQQQLAILEQHSKRPLLQKHDRISCTWLSQLWSNWRSILVIVQHDTVVDRVVEPCLNKFVRRDLSDPAQKCSTHHAESW